MTATSCSLYFSFLLLLLSYHNQVYGSNFLESRKQLMSNLTFSSITDFNGEAPSVNMTGRGIAMCAGNHMIMDAVRQIYILRRVLKSTLPFGIFHCGEITEPNINLLQSIDRYVVVVNMCPSQEGNIFGMGQNEGRKRLRGFFCKVAALISSPFDETMLMDMDSIFFKQPDRLFTTKSYLQSGTLFFRDRTHHSNPKGPQWESDLLKYFQSKDVNTSKENAVKMYEDSGFNLFWGHLAGWPDGSEYHWLGNYCDSSVLLVHKSRHPKLIKELEVQLPSFRFGYGDKEMFWIISTIVGEPFSFEPFLAAQYGDCFGVIMHYDPVDADDPYNASPLYINSEFLTEQTGHSHNPFLKLIAIGDFVKSLVTAPILASKTIAPSSIQEFLTWSHHINHNIACTCGAYQCIPAYDRDNYIILLHQWLVFSFETLEHSGLGSDCMHIKPSHVMSMNKVFETLLTQEDCLVMGCPFLPMTSDHNNNTIDNHFDLKFPWSYVDAKFCDPVSFNITQDTPGRLETEAKKVRNALKPFPEGLLVKFASASVYIVENKKLRLFPNGKTFMVTGRDFSEVQQLPAELVNNFAYGEEIPSV